MTMQNNPTAMSAVVGEDIELDAAPGASGELVKNLIMPGLLLAFATYLLVGIFTMRVPAGTMFPGPQFFPAIITIGLYAFGVLLVISAVKEWRAASAPVVSDSAVDLVEGDHAGELGLAAGVSEAVATESPKHVRVDWRSLAWIVGGFIGFSLSLTILGWIIGATLLFWCVARGFGAKRPLFTLIIGLTTSALTYILFDILLGLSLPSGIIGWEF